MKAVIKEMLDVNALDLIGISDLRTKRYRIMRKISDNKEDFRQMLANPNHYSCVAIATTPQFISAVTGVSEEQIKRELNDECIQTDKLVGMLDIREACDIIDHIERMTDD